MTKFLTLAALLGATSLAFGDGQVSFVNTSSTLVSTNNGFVSGMTLASSTGARYYYGLLYTADTSLTSFSYSSLFDSRWTWSGKFATNTAVGRFTGGTAILAGTTQGSLYNMAVVGWSSECGGAPTQAELENWLIEGSGYFGISSVAQDVEVGGGFYPTPTLFGTGVIEMIPGFTLNLVPEPTSLALAGLGGAIMFRRRMHPGAGSTGRG
jgi:hypothetical protein